MAVFDRALGARFADLPGALRGFHAGPTRRVFKGTASVEHGQGALARFGVMLGGFPPAGQNVPLTVTVHQVREGEHWQRDFGGHVMRSALRYDTRRGQIAERLGLAVCGLTLRLEAAQLHVDVARLTVLGVPLPGALRPRSTSREWEDAQGAFCFDIGAHLPGAGQIIRYHGRLFAAS